MNLFLNLCQFGCPPVSADDCVCPAEQLQAACFGMSVVNDRLASQRFIPAKVCVHSLIQMLGSCQKVAARRDLWMWSVFTLKVGCDSNYSADSRPSARPGAHIWNTERVVLSSFTHVMLSMSMRSLLLKTKTMRYIFVTWNKRNSNWNIKKMV